MSLTKNVQVGTFSFAGMRNLAMSCSLVSLILMGASAVVGGFGICKRQLSAVMVTGVMFILSGRFFSVVVVR